MRFRDFMLPIAVLLLILLAATPNRAFAQGSVTTTLSGTVLDSSGAVVPGANITAKNNATSTARSTVSDPNGLFTIPALEPGDYTVTVTMKGFRTVSLENVRLNAGVPATVRPVLEPGALTETVTVEAAGEMIQTTKTAVAATLGQQQITSLPLPGRAAFDLVTFMPGVTTSDGSARGAMVNGLPTSTVNITLDGMNIQDNYAKSWDGMFTRVSPRLDAVEEVTISTAANSAAAAGQGGVQVKFVTRSGTNDYHGSVYYYLRRDWMNTNTWFNLHRNVNPDTGAPTPKPVMKQFQPGGRFGGPIVRDKLFFFVNYEWISQPGTSTLGRTIMTPLSQQGIFKYSGGTVDLMALAARYGQIATIDPMVARLLGDVRKSTTDAGANPTLTDNTDLLTQRFTWQLPTKSKTTYPTVRVDYNLTSRNKLTGSVTQNHLVSDPDTTNSMQPRFPGFPVHGKQDSVRYSGQGSWQWTMTNTMVNELRFGKTGGATKFYPDLTPDMFAGTGFGGTNGYAIAWSSFRSLTNLYNNSGKSTREGKTTVLEDTLSWQKGSHSLSAGVSYTKAGVWYYQQQQAPTVTLGITSGDPVDATPMFTNANFPGASASDITNAKNLYAVLTGRISSIGREARIQADGTTYTILGASNQYGTLPQWGSFLADTWRATPNLTLNVGLRYDVQRPFYAGNNSYSMATLDDLFGVTGLGSGFKPGAVGENLGNLFKPGVLQGTATTYKMLKQGVNAYNVDWGNLGPSIGVAWNTGAEGGFLHALLGGKGDSVLRGGFNVAYQRGGMSDFTGPLGNNPGIRLDATRNLANGNLGNLPVLLSSSDLGAPSINLTRSYPMSVPNASTNVYVFDPNLKTPSALTYSFSWQRKMTRNMALEARFIHTNSYNTWTSNAQWNYLDYNEVNIIENKFFDEFKLAQANLQANIAGGKGNTFAYTGLPGTSPLPIFLAYLNGSTAVNDATKYTGGGWTNNTMLQSMYPLNPDPYAAANILWPAGGNATYRANGLKAGYPANFWVVNPDVAHAYMVANGPETSYNGVQLSLNRRMSQGLLFELNYTYGKGYMGQFYSFHRPYLKTETNYTNTASASNNSNATGNVRHVFAGNWMYDLPFGRGRRFVTSANGVVDRIIGGWSFQGVARIQSGRMVDIGDAYTTGMRLVGMTADDLRKEFHIRKVQDPNNKYATAVYMLPKDIIDNTIKAFSVGPTGYTAGEPTGRYIAPANSPGCIQTINQIGDCGTRSLILTGPKVVRFDFNFVKQIPVTERISLRGEAEIFNVFNNVNFNPVNYLGAIDTSYQVTGAVDQARTMQLAFRIVF